jgi:GNAT superfamily N-acetyltransferase
LQGRSISIRAASAADLAMMAALINSAFAIETFLEGPRTSEDELRERMQKGTFLLGRDEDGALEASVYVEIRGGRGYFGMLAVDPARQGGGLGRAMVAAAEDYCRRAGCKIMELDVLSLRTELPPFYRKFGYVPIGTEEFRPARPLKPGIECHCIVMSKNL